MLGTDRTPNLDPMIIGIGVDVCDISRWEAAVQRHPGMVRKMLTHTEAVMPARSQAARFAAKEALYKALGGGEGLSWQDCEVVTDGEARCGHAMSPGADSAKGGLQRVAFYLNESEFFLCDYRLWLINSYSTK